MVVRNTGPRGGLMRLARVLSPPCLVAGKTAEDACAESTPLPPPAFASIAPRVSIQSGRRASGLANSWFDGACTAPAVDSAMPSCSRESAPGNSAALWRVMIPVEDIFQEYDGPASRVTVGMCASVAQRMPCPQHVHPSLGPRWRLPIGTPRVEELEIDEHRTERSRGQGRIDVSFLA